MFLPFYVCSVKMNILFLLRSIGVGGVEVVTATLANKFVAEGHNVAIFAREFRKTNLADRLSPQIHLYIGCGDNDCKENVDALHKVYVKENVQIVVNQWGLPYKPIRLARKAEKNHKVKIISFHHNDPATNGRLNAIELKLKENKSFLKKILFMIQRKVYHTITSFSMRYTYDHSERFMVLSNSYLEHLRKFINVSEESKQGVLTNPVTVDKGDYIYSQEKKEKSILFCGRLDNVQKCPVRVLEVWNNLSPKFKDWSLYFIGDGPDRSFLEHMAKEKNLQNVYFEGFQNPVEYYKKASILAMTSDFEGFPLVLAECMNFGVVPCVYNSFAALHDIIQDKENGLIIEKENGLFSSEKMAEELSKIMHDESKLRAMAKAAVKTSENFSIDTIYDRWEKVLSEITACS